MCGGASANAARGRIHDLWRSKTLSERSPSKKKSDYSKELHRFFYPISSFFFWSSQPQRKKNRCVHSWVISWQMFPRSISSSIPPNFWARSLARALSALLKGALWQTTTGLRVSYIHQAAIRQEDAATPECHSTLIVSDLFTAQYYLYFWKKNKRLKGDNI